MGNYFLDIQYIVTNDKLMYYTSQPDNYKKRLYYHIICPYIYVIIQSDYILTRITLATHGTYILGSRKAC